MSAPVRYHPSLERVAPGEAAAARELASIMRKIAGKTARHYGLAVRSVHAKSHALLEGELEVLPGLAPELAQGLFARPATYPAVLRFSTNPGDILDDAVSAPRGLGLKVIGVPGARLPGSERDVTQDFVLANGPAFIAADAAAFLGALKALAATTDRAEGVKRALSAVLRGAEAGLEAAGFESALARSLGGQPLTHPLGETFHSQTPLRWGDHVAKVSVAPVSPGLTRLAGAAVALDGDPNALRREAIAAMAADGGEWELRAQLLTDPERMPVEDASVVWPEALSPHVAVARVRVAPQPAWSEGRGQDEDRLAFSPWHGLVAHRPLGSLNRARRPAYAAIAAFRGQYNGVAVAEPRGPAGLSGAPASAVPETSGRQGMRGVRPGGPLRGAAGPALAVAGVAAVAGLAWAARERRRVAESSSRRSSMTDLSQVREHMKVVGADGVHLGTVDKVEGGRIKLTKADSGSHGDHHHYIAGGLVAAVEDGRVRLSATAANAAALEEERDGRPLSDLR